MNRKHVSPLRKVRRQARRPFQQDESPRRLTHEQSPSTHVLQQAAGNQATQRALQSLPAREGEAPEQRLQSDRFRGHPVFLAVLEGARLLRWGAAEPGAVAAVQSALHALGFNAGPVDGRWGPQTNAAVLSFQHARGLAADGVIGPNTLRVLDRADAAGGGGGPEPADERAGLAPLFDRLTDPETPAAEVDAVLGQIMAAVGRPPVPLGFVAFGAQPQGAVPTPGLDALLQAVRQMRKAMAVGPPGVPMPQTVGETHAGIADLDNKPAHHPDQQWRAWYYWHNQMIGFERMVVAWRDRKRAGQKVNTNALAAVTVALGYVGLVEANRKGPDGRRVGWHHLDTIFREACKPTFYDTNLQSAVRAPSPFPALPHWCGIFTNFACLRAGATQGQWPSPGYVQWKAFEFKQVARPDPKPGDVMNAPTVNNHFALCIDYDPETRTVTTIDGNTAPGGGASGGQIVVQRRQAGPAAFWRGFFVAPV